LELIDNGILRPNKTYVVEYLRDTGSLGIFKRTIVITADNETTVRAYLKKTVDSEPDELTWLMDCNYKVIRDQKGSNSLPVQAKILYNTTAIVAKK